MPTTVAEIEHILNKVHSWNICAGGPSKTLGAKIRLEAASIDGQIWRHDNCSVLLEEGTSCMKCISVTDLLRKRIDYGNKLNFRLKMTKQIGKGRKIIKKKKQLHELGCSRLKSTPRSKKKIAMMKAELKNLDAQLSRRDKKVKELEDSFAEIGEKNAESIFTEFFSRAKKEIPEPQVIKIHSCFLYHIKKKKKNHNNFTYDAF